MATHTLKALWDEHDMLFNDGFIQIKKETNTPFIIKLIQLMVVLHGSIKNISNYPPNLIKYFSNSVSNLPFYYI